MVLINCGHEGQTIAAGAFEGSADGKCWLLRLRARQRRPRLSEAVGRAHVNNSYRWLQRRSGPSAAQRPKNLVLQPSRDPPASDSPGFGAIRQLLRSSRIAPPWDIAVRYRYDSYVALEGR